MEGEDTMRRRGRLLLGCLILLLFASFARGEGEAPAGRNVFLWKVTSETGTAYLLGSIHLLKKDMYPLDRRIEEAFAESSVLAVETDVGARGKEKLGKFVMENALYPDGDSLEKHVSRETYDLVRRRFQGLGMAGVDRMKPWALALTATTIEYMKMGLNPEYGIDRYFLEKAEGRKKIVELEAYDYVVNLLKELPDGTQDLFLFYTLTDLATVGREADRIIAYWSAGDVSGMEAMIYRSRDEYPKLLPVFEILVSRRNGSMSDKIEGYLRNGKTCFVVVGAAHLVGKDGIPERLREKGYAVEQR
jgi:hypothetical protein